MTKIGGRGQLGHLIDIGNKVRECVLLDKVGRGE